jgi:Family of unknown function (DUF6492)
MPFKRFFSPSIFINYYSQTDNTPNLIEVFIPVVITLLRFRVRTTFQLIRFTRILRIKENNSANTAYSLPIELLVVCGPQDTPILPLCIKSAIQFSANPISSVVIIVPDSDVEMTKETLLVMEKTINIPISVVRENEYIPIEIRTKLKRKFEERFGWILQQVIKVKYAAQSEAGAVLVIDADTVLLQPLRGISENSEQHLSYSSEMHKSYREFLKYIQIPMRRPFFSTVTHHMIIQPTIMRELLINVGIQDLDKLTEKLLTFNSKSVMSPISIDYEMYGQYLRSRYPNKINYYYFSNLSVRRSPEAFQQVEDILKGARTPNYRSFSFHGYL